MILAELVVYHSRPYSPTRRLALGHRHLPTEPRPGFGGILLGGMLAVAGDELDPELVVDFHRLLADLETGRRVVQPRLRHRFQTDHVGLARSRAVLRGSGEGADFDVDGHISPLQMALAVAYAAGQLPAPVRPAVFTALRRGLRWTGPVGPELASHLAGRGDDGVWTPGPEEDPVRWALGVLGFTAGDDARRPGRRDVQRRFRERLRAVHPDHGGELVGAAHRIAEITEARRILLGA